MLTLACIPAFNEDKVIEGIINECKKAVNQVVVCDDGSTDQTYTISEKAGAIVLRHGKNKGKGAAMRSLFRYALEVDADAVVMIDGDGQFNPQEITKLLDELNRSGVDIVIGKRYANSEEMPLYRKMGNKALDRLTNMASEVRVQDTQSGFRVYGKKALDLAEGTSDGFGADSEIIINAAKKGLRISEIPVTVLYDIGGETSTKNPISHTTDVVTSIIEMVALEHPLRYLGIPGLILTIVGIIFSIIVISIFNEIRYFSIPSTLVALGSTTLGVLLILVAVVLYAIIRLHHRM